jgi:hypothetical protein
LRLLPFLSKQANGINSGLIIIRRKYGVFPKEEQSSTNLTCSFCQQNIETEKPHSKSDNSDVCACEKCIPKQIAIAAVLNKPVEERIQMSRYDLEQSNLLWNSSGIDGMKKARQDYEKLCKIRKNPSGNETAFKALRLNDGGRVELKACCPKCCREQSMVCSEQYGYPDGRKADVVMAPLVLSHAYSVMSEKQKITCSQCRNKFVVIK